MSTAEQRVAVFQDTLAWIESDPELTEAVKHSKAATKVYFEDDYPDYDGSRKLAAKITVTGDRTYQAAMRLHKENPRAKIAVLNFANAFHAGGGVTRGSSAQEESLCRCSTLYPLLYRKTLRDSYYKFHCDKNNPKASDALIYTEDVVICKTDEDVPKRMSREDWVKVDVITMAAPDLRSKSNRYATLVNSGSYMNKAEMFGYHVRRAIHMLTVAAAKEVDVLVLGAFGCGAFENNPKVVAKAYKVALEQFKGQFRTIEFAVYCGRDKSNYEAFCDELAFEEEKKRLTYLPGMFEAYKREPNPEHWIDSGFAELMWGLGFEMDCYKSYEDKFGDRAYLSKIGTGLTDEELQDHILANLEQSELQIVGNYVFSRFRYLTHWCDYGYEPAECGYFFERAFKMLEEKLDIGV